MGIYLCFLGRPVVWTALSTIATFSVVLVALWQTKYANKKRLKLKFYAATLYDELTSSTPDVITCQVANNGNRKVIITNYFISIKKDKNFFIITHRSKIAPITFPHTLNPEESVNLIIEKEGFIKTVKNQVKENPKIKKKRVKICVTDSLGKIYSTKTKQTFGEWAKE